MEIVRRRSERVLCLVAVVLILVPTVDVLVTGPLRSWDQRLMLGPGGLEATGWAHLFWRVVVMGGQFWLVGTLVTVTAAIVAFRHRSLRLFAAFGAWIVVVNVVVQVFKLLVGRTAPHSGADVLHAGTLSYPSGHAALGAACLLMTAALLGPELAPRTARRVTLAAHVLAVAAALATVLLAYHWPTDSLAGWALGVLLGVAGRYAVVVPGARKSPSPGAVAMTAPG
ncbi:phosphatase PAP2 family protein, partial [Actinomadura scrupuli]|uniref:phosphatase PAP2 family protein n=1 Tax=Actinomadura scrupuli TaxID=559629 RepID=UPI003D96FE53